MVGLFGVFAAAEPFVVTRTWAGLLAALVLFGLAGLAHLLIMNNTGAQATVAVAPAANPAVAPEVQTQVSFRRRGVKALVIGADGRASTSKVQVVLWTFAVFYALTFLLLWGRSTGCADLEDIEDSPCAQAVVGRQTFDHVANGELQHEYYALLGLPLLAAITAKAVTVGKLAEGEIGSNAIEAEQGGIIDGLGEVVSNNSGETDLIDFQYFAFTLLALAYFFTQFLSQPAGGLPDLPPTLVGLMGVSAGAYTAKKAVAKDLPEADGAEDPSEPEGDS